jgi:hypothetical protein
MGASFLSFSATMTSVVIGKGATEETLLPNRGKDYFSFGVNFS